MKVLLVNPWAVKNDEYYSSGFVSGMNNWVDIDFFTNRYYNGETPNGRLYKEFFRKSEKMERSSFRKLLRGAEYIISWIKLFHIASKKNYDVIHFHWLLKYDVDAFFLKKLRKKCGRLVLTAHNVIPHVNGEQSIDALKKVYGCFDKILVHGETIKQEFAEFFPEEVRKVSIQYHGEYYNQNTEYKYLEQPEYAEIKGKIDKYERVFITFGNQFYNKGTDRLVKIWLENFALSNALLIIIGKLDKTFAELMELSEQINSTDNIVLISHYVEDNFLNYCATNSNCIVLPYRHASMSGVVFTAASFSKPVICTKSGAIAEYLENGEDSFVCENNSDSLKESLMTAMRTELKLLADMGERLQNNIKNKYAWHIITKQVAENEYKEITK